MNNNQHHFTVPLVGLLCCCVLFTTLGQPVTSKSLVIDAAPSVVSYQGSSQSYAHLVISPRGRALGYVAPTNLNHTVHHTEKVKESLDFLDIRPVYNNHNN
ncbi:uncharacterized protein LOC133327377 [Musca vetustissima]|uniref:uncharacterized protein LOC133327377 n=1 Tax=Musca vetustissima TaxID=27455 RepID=UPI002AB5DFE2|nr:uncharacterized protein LOC133327377 [Musca vetustissima]